MTPTIATDALFLDKAPEDAMDESALELVPFEFFPHLGSSPSYLPDLVRYSTRTSRPIIACNDGDGLVVSHGQVLCIGQPIWIERGQGRPARDTVLSAIQSSA